MIRADRVIPAVLADVIRKAPLCPEKVDFAWQSAVGGAVARATSVKLNVDGTLEVTAIDEQWAQEVRRSTRLIAVRLAALLGAGVVKHFHVRAK